MIDSSQKMKKMTISSEHKERNNQEKEEQHQRQQQQQQQLEKNSSAMDDNDDDNDNDEEGKNIPGIQFVNYHDESQLDYVMRLVGTDLSEPYSGTYPRAWNLFRQDRDFNQTRPRILFLLLLFDLNKTTCFIFNTVHE